MNWYENIIRPAPTQNLRLINNNAHSTLVTTADGEMVGQTPQRIDLLKNGVYYATVNDNSNDLTVVYIGAGENPFNL